MHLETEIKKKRKARLKRHRSIRKKISGTADIPRLCVYRTARHTYVQLINDSERKTILGVSSLTPEVREKLKYGGNIEAAKILGQFLAQKAQELKIKKVVFDRAGYKYHGRVKALADAAREAGLEF